MPSEGPTTRYPPIGQRAEQVVDDDLFRVAIEIDQHVANEDAVKRRLRQRLYQVVSLEFDQLLDLRPDLPEVIFRQMLKVSSPLLFGDRLDGSPV